MSITQDIMAPQKKAPFCFSPVAAMAHVQHGQLAVVCRALNVTRREEQKGLSRADHGGFWRKAMKSKNNKDLNGYHNKTNGKR